MCSQKTCNWCNQSQPLPNFSKWKYGKDGHRAICKKCESKPYHENKEYREKVKKQARDYFNKLTVEQKREYHRKSCHNYYLRNRAKMMLSLQSYQYRLKTGITAQVWNRAKNCCEQCGGPLKHGRGQNSIHHINGDKQDDRLDNLRLLCTHCHLHLIHAKKPS